MAIGPRSLVPPAALAVALAFSPTPRAQAREDWARGPDCLPVLSFGAREGELLVPHRRPPDAPRPAAPPRRPVARRTGAGDAPGAAAAGGCPLHRVVGEGAGGLPELLRTSSPGVRP